MFDFVAHVDSRKTQGRFNSDSANIARQLAANFCGGDITAEFKDSGLCPSQENTQVVLYNNGYGMPLHVWPRVSTLETVVLRYYETVRITLLRRQ